jgi:hypothetical protein
MNFGGNTVTLYIQRNGSAKRLHFDSVGGINVDSGVLDGNWHQLVATTTTGGVETVYLDGAQIGQTTSGATVMITYNNNNNQLEIGGEVTDLPSDPTGVINGTIDDVRIYNRALSAAEVQVAG